MAGTSALEGSDLVSEGSLVAMPGSSGNIRARFEQWAQHPTCQANTIAAVPEGTHGARAIPGGYKPTFGQLPFALARGQTFERNLLREDAGRLIIEPTRHGVLPEGTAGLAGFRLAKNGGPLSGIEVAIEATRDLVDGL